jgi:serine/threonine protein kinase
MIPRCLLCGGMDSFSEQEMQTIKDSFYLNFTQIDPPFPLDMGIMNKALPLLETLSHERCGRILSDVTQQSQYCMAIIDKTFHIWPISPKSFASGSHCFAYDAGDSKVFKQAKLVDGLPSSKQSAEKAFTDVVHEYQLLSQIHTDPKFVELRDKVIPFPEAICSGEYQYKEATYLKVGHIGNRYITLMDRLYDDMPFSKQVHLCQRLIEIVAAFHRHGFFICDLKPENLFIGHDGKLILADIGSLRNIENLKKSPYTPRYSLMNDLCNCDEISDALKNATDEKTAIDLKQTFSMLLEKRDVAALGMVCYQIFTRTHALRQAIDRPGCIVPLSFEIQQKALEAAGTGAFLELFTSMIADPRERIDSRTALERFQILFLDALGTLPPA